MSESRRDRTQERYEDRADYQRAEETVVGQLRDRGVRLYGDERGEPLIELLEAVQAFEAAVAEVGGDSMLNAPDSKNPENPAFVLPRRYDDESLTAYVRRVERAARGLRGR